MKKNYSNKMISESENKGQPKSQEKELNLLCIKECVAPGYGYFKPGDVVKDQDKVNYLKSNPNFEEIKEVA